MKLGSWNSAGCGSTTTRSRKCTTSWDGDCPCIVPLPSVGPLNVPPRPASCQEEIDAATRELAEQKPDRRCRFPAEARAAQRGRGAADWQGTEERLAARAMMGRIGEPGDIANAVVFLVSPESGWITAQMLTVDGGRMDYVGQVNLGSV